MSLEELYRYLNWRMNPADKRARDRFERIKEFFESISDGLPHGGRILDICAGTGVAGVALAKATRAKLLTVLDARKDDLELASEWLKIADINPKLNLVQGDARETAKLVGEHDVAVLWGYTMPHFDPFDAVRLFANVASILSDDGVFIIEDMDRVYWILYRAGYKKFLIEGRRENYTIASMHEGYDFARGTFKRGYYIIPGFKKISDVDFHYWDLATQLAIGGVFFKEAELITQEEHGRKVGDILLFRKPRKKVAEEILASYSV
ncbi:class I SAM-dependent methyltransferase [Thermococcus peptonophilus]|uniref:SAM-dependent methyltransferase n=1 Tax=Thermococcus peptonophilus TaxID=53952 RepID=A0A142CUN3_9EURY|nr:class I SAM-dependent methyltransferase [Thermococcus peptonophilus]AMQ18485.1 SAM-dependent methyltransferase [Thermococcus peptonophilus]